MHEEQPQNIAFYKDKRFWCIFTSIIESILLGHDLVSFQTLEYALRENDFYSNKTEEQKVLTYSRLYSCIWICLTVFGFLTGAIIDKWGLWHSRSVGHLFLLIGTISAIFITPTNDYLLWIAYPCFYTGGWLLIESHIFIWPLYPEQFGKIVALEGVAISAAQLWYTYYKQICIPFSNLKYWWMMMLCFIPISVFRTFYFNPKLKATKDYSPKIGWEARFDTYEMVRQERLEASNDLNNENEKHNGSVFLNKDFWKELIKIPNLCLIIWWFLVELKITFYVSEFQPWLRFKVDDDSEDVSHYSEVYNYMLLVGIAIEPICGFFIDLFNKFYEKVLKLNSTKTAILMSQGLFIWGSCAICLQSFLQATKFYIWTVNLTSALNTLTEATRWTGKFIYTFAVVDERFTATILAVQGIFAVLTKLLVPLFGQLATEVFDGDWSELCWILGYIEIGSLIFPLLVIYIFFFGPRSASTREGSISETEIEDFD